MPFGRRWFGWGGGWGRGRGWGRGLGNPYPFCRNFPWLPRWWWAAPYAGQYRPNIPYRGYGRRGYPYYGGYGQMGPY